MPFVFQNLPKQQIYLTQAEGLSISYRLQEPESAISQKLTLVFLHGYNGSSKSWYFQFTHFQNHRIIAIDSPGFGSTSFFQGGMPRFADEVITLLQELTLEPILLVGHSMGGMLAQVIAGKEFLNCAGLVLSCTHMGRGKHHTEPLSEEIKKRLKQRELLSDKDYGYLRIERMLNDKPYPDILEFLVSIAGEIRIAGINWGGAAIQYLDTTPYLKKITVPTLILSASNDIVVKPTSVDALIGNMPNAKHIQMDNVGHAPYCENAEAFNRNIYNFISNHF